MNLNQALEVTKSVFDQSIANGNIKKLEDTATLTEAYNTLVGAANFIAQNTQQVVEPTVAEPTVAVEVPKAEETATEEAPVAENAQ
jgi:hypothetical protein